MPTCAEMGRQAEPVRGGLDSIYGALTEALERVEDAHVRDAVRELAEVVRDMEPLIPW